LRQLLVDPPRGRGFRTLGRRPFLGFAAAGIVDRIKGCEIAHQAILTGDCGNFVTAMLH
jgi:hypothetical protein